MKAIINNEYEPRTTEVLCYFVRKSAVDGKSELARVERNKYPHPDAPEHANMEVLEEAVCESDLPPEIESALFVHEHTENVLKGFVKNHNLQFKTLK